MNIGILSGAKRRAPWGAGERRDERGVRDPSRQQKFIGPENLGLWELPEPREPGWHLPAKTQMNITGHNLEKTVPEVKLLKAGDQL